MASLYSKMKARDFRKPEKPSAYYESVLATALERSRPPNCILINIQSVADDVMGVLDGDVYCELNNKDFAGMRLTPPYESMWMEFTAEYKTAIQTIRITIPDDGGHLLTLLHWVEHNGQLSGPLIECSLLLDRLGNQQGLLRPTEPMLLNGFGIEESFVASIPAIHALARMNCRNVHVQPVAGGGKVRRHPKNLAPSSIWHEIKVTAAPKVRTTSKASSCLPLEDSQQRAFPIRGHYADYRNGPGLFGNPDLKCVFWIPEHWQGNKEFGQVVPSYTIASASA